MKIRKTWVRILFGTVFSLFIGVFLWTSVEANDISDVNGLNDPRPRMSHGNKCLYCHVWGVGFEARFEDGEEISLYVNSGVFQGSVHGVEGMECIDCHQATGNYPHHDESQLGCVDCHGEDGMGPVLMSQVEVRMPFATRREMELFINEGCLGCHDEQRTTDGSVHNEVFSRGNIYAPVCIDCHGGHDITSPNRPRTKISQICEECHLSVYTTYQFSVHGAALEEEANLDVPSCADCHGMHSVTGPAELSFRNESIQMCAECHADEEMMTRYGVSVDVFETYLDDYHGRTVNLLGQDPRNVPSNKAVCYDCHGIHNILAPDDPNSYVYPENLQGTCQECHPDASIEFPRAWLSHYAPTLETNPVLWAVELAYPALIIFTLTFFVVYIALDAQKRWREHLAKDKHKH